MLQNLVENLFNFIFHIFFKKRKKLQIPLSSIFFKFNNFIKSSILLFILSAVCRDKR